LYNNNVEICILDVKETICSIHYNANNAICLNKKFVKFAKFALLHLSKRKFYFLYNFFD